MGYLYLPLAIMAEVIGTSALKSSEEFTKLIPSIIVVVGYGAAFYFLSLVLKTIPVGIAYVIWARISIVLLAIIGMILIVAGVVVINAFQKLSHTKSNNI